MGQSRGISVIYGLLLTTSTKLPYMSEEDSDLASERETEIWHNCFQLSYKHILNVSLIELKCFHQMISGILSSHKTLPKFLTTVLQGLLKANPLWSSPESFSISMSCQCWTFVILMLTIFVTIMFFFLEGICLLYFILNP